MFRMGTRGPPTLPPPTTAPVRKSLPSGHRAGISGPLEGGRRRSRRVIPFPPRKSPGLRFGGGSGLGLRAPVCLEQKQPEKGLTIGGTGR